MAHFYQNIGYKAHKSEYTAGNESNQSRFTGSLLPQNTGKEYCGDGGADVGLNALEILVYLV